ncbi:TldD/PmbA family protein [candidate division KSB1 bacterium]|nr:MAG: TldD/PmbA family protein [candidate division KSB1 bacterium]
MNKIKLTILLLSAFFICRIIPLNAQYNDLKLFSGPGLFKWNNFREEKDWRTIILSAMKEELIRSKENLRFKDYQPPYFISYWIKEIESIDLAAKYGAIYSDNNDKTRTAFVEVRVGDYSFDNTGQKGSGFFFGSDHRLYSDSYIIPVENDESSIRNVLWYITDFKYKEAINNYLKKKGQAVFEAEEEHIDSFSREKGYKYIAPPLKFNFDKKFWKKVLKDITAYFNDFKDIFESKMRVNARKEINYYVNTEGSEIIQENVYYSIHISANTRAKDGMLLSNFRDFNYRLDNNLPDYRFLMNEAKNLAKELLMLREAEVLKPYTGPAILEPDVTGVIFHEAVGHRLEGERQKDEESGQTFKDKIGEKILPEFISIIDDPTIKEFNSTNLYGYYEYDDEGVPARRVLLVENGILRNYLMSRTPIKGFNKSNGHGRSSGSSWSSRPMGRMSNLFIKSSKEWSYEKLKKALIEECKKQNKPYGLIIKHIKSGETNTSKYGFQAFKQTPRLIYTVDVNTGEEKLVRGAEIVGTPLTSINKIIATSDNYLVVNSYCGAESGFIPVSTIAPAILTSEIELQRTGEIKGRPPLLPPPAYKGK